MTHKQRILDYKVNPLKREGLEFVTTNGEICYDYDTNDYVAFDETYAYEIGRSNYPLCALAMFETYCEFYLVM